MPRPNKKQQQQQIEEESSEYDSDMEQEEEEEEEFDLIGALNEMDTAQRRRVYGLKSLIKKTRAIQRKKNDAIAALEQAFIKKCQPLQEKRRDIVAGKYEPTDAEAAKGVDPTESKVEEIADSDEEEKKPKRKGVTVQVPKEEEAKDLLRQAGEKTDGGIPAFWLTAIKHNEMLENLVNPRDEEVLACLTDVVSSFPENDPRKGFSLTFHFSENRFFTNKQITKTYLMDPEEEDEDVLDKAVADEINWTSIENKLTVILKQKKQRHKSGKGIRVVQKEEKCASFFQFFSPPGEDDEDEDEMLEMDYEAGVVFHKSLVPRAVHHYTGEAMVEMAAGLMGGGGDMGDSDEEDEEEEDEEGEEDSEEDEQPKAKKAAKKGGKGGEQPECKQQ